MLAVKTHLMHIGVLNVTDYLNTLRIKVVKEARQLQGRTVGIRLGDLYIFNIYSGIISSMVEAFGSVIWPSL